MTERRFDWRVPALAVAVGAVAVGAVAGGLGAFTSRHPQEPAQAPVTARGAKAQPLADDDGAPPDSRAERTRLQLEPNLDLLTRCGERPAAANVRVRRLDQEPTRTRWTQVWRGTTDPQGRSPLMLDPGNYGLAVSAECGSAQQTLTVRAGEARHTLTVVLEPGWALAGRVVEAGSGNPVADALVSARTLMRLPSGQSEPTVEEEAATTTADSLGRFRLENVAKARQVVHATANGFGDAELEVEGPEQELTLKLERSCALSGQVRGGDGVVTLTVRSGKSEASVFANPDGSFKALAPPGDVQVVARSESGLTALTRFPLGRECAAKPIELSLRPGGISGKATVEGSGPAAACARVWARTEADEYELASAQAAPDGSFTLDGLPAGFYWVLASCASGERGDALHVEPGKAIEIAMRGASSLSGRVTDDQHRPVAGAKVEVEPMRGTGYEALTDERGEYALEHLPSVAMWVDARADGAASESEQVQLRPGTAERVDLELARTGWVVGHVKGKIPPKASALLHEMNGRGGARADIGEDGEFKIEVAAGKYGVRGMLPHGGELFGLSVVEVAAGQQVEKTFEVSEAPERTDLHFSSVTPGEIGVMFDRGPGGLSISWIATNGPAYAAGVREGDLVLSIDGQALDDTVEAYQRARGQPGSPLVIQVRREGRDQQLAINRAGKQEPF